MSRRKIAIKTNWIIHLWTNTFKLINNLTLKKNNIKIWNLTWNLIKKTIVSWLIKKEFIAQYVKKKGTIGFSSEIFIFEERYIIFRHKTNDYFFLCHATYDIFTWLQHGSKYMCFLFLAYDFFFNFSLL